MKNRENMEERFDFADFYECHYRQALRYASMYVFNNEDARDIVSDVLLRFLEQKGKLNRERNIVGLFFSMIHNKCMDYLRRMSRFKQIENKLKQTADRFSDSEFEALCHKELFRIIGEILSNMPALQQEVFLDVHMEGQTYLEVAEARNITKRVVEYQLRKAERTVGCSLQRMYG
jgi:RNA polymerase sigma factor (sigma-70 family)